MKIEEQVVSLELAKKLKELGVKQESYFYWDVATDDGAVELFSRGQVRPAWLRMSETFAAFTVAELALIMPEKRVMLDTANNYCMASVIRLDGVSASKSGSNIQEAMAKLLICLIERKLLTQADKESL